MKFFVLRFLCRSSNNLSLNLRSTSPEVGLKLENPVSKGPPSNLPDSTAKNDAVAEKASEKQVSNNKLTEQSLLSGNASVQENFMQFSVKHDFK